MIRKRTIGTLTALGATTVALALMLGQPAAKADDVTDLQANPELLKRIDQLAQVGTEKPQLPPGTPSIAGSFPRSFLIPGTETSLQIGGYVDLSTAYYFQGGGPNSNGSTPPGTGGALAAGLPLNLSGPAGTPFAAAAFNASSRQNGWFRMQADESRVYFETRTPTVYGEALTHLELDFGGCAGAGSATDCSDQNRSTNSWLPRLRLAYGTLGGFMAGQNWVPGNDLAASPEIFDFFGDVGQWGYARAPQIGYKTALPWVANDATIGVYLVQPNGALATPLGGIESDTALTNNPPGVGGLVNGDIANLAFNPLKDPLPDGALVLNWEQPWGHFQLHGVVRDMEMDDGHFLSQEYIGYGGGFSGAVHPAWFGWVKDNLGFQAFTGTGLSHWGNNWTGSDTNTTQALASNFGGPGLYGNATATGCTPGTTAATFVTGAKCTTAVALTAANAAAIRTTTVPAWGGEVNYQHWWTPTLRSTATFGIGHQDIPTNLIGPVSAANFNYNKELITAHLNLIWSPVPFINTGFEYTYDRRQTVWNQHGQGQVLDFDFLVKF